MIVLRSTEFLVSDPLHAINQMLLEAGIRKRRESAASDSYRDQMVSSTLEF